MTTSTTPQGVNNYSGLEIATTIIQRKLYGDANKPYTAAAPPVIERGKETFFMLWPEGLSFLRDAQTDLRLESSDFIELVAYEFQLVLDYETSYSADKDNIKDYAYEENNEYEYIKSYDDLHNIIQELATYDFENFDFHAFYLDKDHCTCPHLTTKDISHDIEGRKVGTIDVLTKMQDCLILSFTPSKYVPSPFSGVQPTQDPPSFPCRALFCSTAPTVSTAADDDPFPHHLSILSDAPDLSTVPDDDPLLFVADPFHANNKPTFGASTAPTSCRFRTFFHPKRDWYPFCYAGTFYSPLTNMTTLSPWTLITLVWLLSLSLLPLTAESLPGVLLGGILGILFLPDSRPEYLLGPTQADIHFSKGIPAVLPTAYAPPMSNVPPADIKVFNFPPLDAENNDKLLSQATLNHDQYCDIASIALPDVCSIRHLSRYDVSYAIPVTPDVVSVHPRVEIYDVNIHYNGNDPPSCLQWGNMPSFTSFPTWVLTLRSPGLCPYSFTLHQIQITSSSQWGKRDGRVGRPQGQRYQVQNETNRKRDGRVGRPQGQPYQVQNETNRSKSWVGRPQKQPYLVLNRNHSWVGRLRGQPYQTMQDDRYQVKGKVITQGGRHQGTGEMTLLIPSQTQTQGDHCQSVGKVITGNNTLATVHRLRPSLVVQTYLVVPPVGTEH